ncbi:MAG TPA: VWA domain-containing protein [Terriglobales bacterium]|nr:VWA domain-containing protein [Terriglobales bacterium]
MRLKANDGSRILAPPVAPRRWGATLIVVGVWLLLTAMNVEGQTPSATPPAPVTAGAAQPASSPSSASAAQDNGATGMPQAQPSDQAAGDGQDTVFVFKKEVQEVGLHATVVDQQRHLVTNLDRSAFTVFEDGVRQTTTSFHRDDVPVAMGIVIDNSGSMREKRDKVNQAVLNLIRAGNPDDEIFVVNFSQDSYLDQDFTSDINLLQQALQKVSAQGSTALYDAIVASAVHLKNNTRVDRKVLLVITDGRDNASQETLQEATRRLQQENGPTLYAIGLLSDELQQSGTGALQSLADSTGGVAFFPQSLDEVDGITRTVAHDIRSQYTIGYKPTNPKQNAGYRRILVTAQAPGYRNLTVRTRSGYYPGEAVR